jgi:hypothetical protein
VEEVILAGLQGMEGYPSGSKGRKGCQAEETAKKNREVDKDWHRCGMGSERQGWGNGYWKGKGVRVLKVMPD